MWGSCVYSRGSLLTSHPIRAKLGWDTWCAKLRKELWKTLLWFIYSRFAPCKMLFGWFSFPVKFNRCSHLKNWSSKCILKFPWIGLQPLKCIFGKAVCSQTWKWRHKPPFLSSSRRILSQSRWRYTSFHRFVAVCLKNFSMVFLSTPVLNIFKYWMNFQQLEGLPVAYMLKRMEDFAGRGCYLFPL